MRFLVPYTHTDDIPDGHEPSSPRRVFRWGRIGSNQPKPSGHRLRFRPETGACLPRWETGHPDGLAQRVPGIHVAHYAAREETDPMNRKNAFLLAAGTAVFAIVVSTCQFPIRSTMESEIPAKLVDSANPPDLASLTNGANSAAALQAAIPTSQSSGSVFEAAPSSPILPLSPDGAVNLVFSSIGLAPNLKRPWSLQKFTVFADFCRLMNRL